MIALAPTRAAPLNGCWLRAELEEEGEPMSTPHVAFREWFDRVRRGEAPKPPIARLLGFEVTAANDGEAIALIDADGRLANPMGTLHGGVICDIADAAMGCALASTLEADESFTTVELKANFFKPIWNARLHAKARVVRRTRSLSYLECDVVDVGGSLVARVASTCMILRGENADGR
jgi:uncharacterized protein (TIGR00369 family)